MTKKNLVASQTLYPVINTDPYDLYWKFGEALEKRVFDNKEKVMLPAAKAAYVAALENLQRFMRVTKSEEKAAELKTELLKKMKYVEGLNEHIKKNPDF